MYSVDFGKKQNLKLSYLFFALLFFPSILWAQNRTLKGNVVDAKNEPMIGVTVMVKGTSNGTMTDVSGNFSISVPENSAIVISYMGYMPQEVPVRDQSFVKVILEEDEKMLDEVVVVGFGTQKKVNLTGSVGVATAKDIESRPVTSAVSALQGVVSGLNISNGNMGGELNASKSINIRGTGTISSGSSGSPLILIDGMEGDINLLNPQDIDNVSVLKDAAASAIYGSRAPFGVILITTKSGKAGKTTINYNNSFRFNTPVFTPNIMNSWEYVNYFNDVERYSSGGLYFTDHADYLDKVYSYYSGASDEFMSYTSPVSVNGKAYQRYTSPYANVNWAEEYYSKWAMSQEHNLSASGGTEKLTYYISTNYLTQDGFMKHGTDYIDRYTITGKIGAQITDYAKVDYSSRWIRRDYNRAKAMNGGFYDNMMRRAAPIYPVKDPNGYYSEYSYITALEDGGRRQEQDDNIVQQLKLTISPTKNWSIMAEMNVKIDNNWTHEYSFPVYAHAADDPSALFISGEFNNGDVSYVYEESYRGTYLNPNIYSNYNLSFGKNNFNTTVGTQIEQFVMRNLTAGGSGLVSEKTPVLNMATLFGDSPNGIIQDWSTVGFFGRISYDYDERYLLEINARYDGSSRFRRDKRWVLSPSVSAGWNITKENFWEDMLAYVQVLKPRISYGQLANQNTSDYYPTYRTLDVYMNASDWLINGAKPNTAAFPGLITTLLTWEKVRTFNVGLDFGVLNNRLSGSFDYYQRTTLDMMGPGIKLPATLGTYVPSTNNTDLKTSGWELTVSWRDKIRDFTYGARFNLSDDRTKILRYPNEAGEINYQNFNALIPGEYMGNIYGLVTKGVARDADEMAAHLASLPNGGQDAIGSEWQAGDMMYEDINGDGKVSMGSTINDLQDLKLIGNTTPRFRTGITIDMGWKEFDFSMFWQGVLKRDYYFSPVGGAGAGAKSAVFWGATSGNIHESLFFKEHLDYWRDDTSELGANYDSYFGRPLFYGSNRNRYVQTRFLQNAAYLRLKNVQIGYSLPKKWLYTVKIEKLRIFFSGENLLTFTQLSSVLDPESLDVGKMKSGGSYPLSKTFSVGLSVNL